MHYIEPNTIDAILSQATADLVGLVQSYGVELKKQGRYWVGKSPFRDDKNPSFNVDPSRGRFIDWAAQEYRGNAFRFVMLMERCEWLEAAHKLAERYGIDTEPELTDTQRAERDRRSRLREAMTAAQQYFSTQLTQTAEGQALIEDYLLPERLLDPADLQRFGLGLSSQAWDGLLRYLQQAGFETHELKDAGLINFSDKSQKYYDTFRGRLMFPIMDQQGRTVAFAGRKLPGSAEQAKYINSRETPIYKKSEVLYGLHWAKDSLAKEDLAILVEGYTDVIALHKAGVSTAIASCGTALTPQQVQLIKRYAQTVVIMRDGDAAGQKATARDIELLLEQGLMPHVCTLPTEHDPDTFLQAHGAVGFRAYLDEFEQDWLAWSVEKLGSIYDLQQPDGKAKASDELMSLVRKISHPVLREEYAAKVTEALDLRPELAQELLDQQPMNLGRAMKWTDLEALYQRLGLSVGQDSDFHRAEDGGIEIAYFRLSGRPVMRSQGGQKRPLTRVTTMAEQVWGVYIPPQLRNDENRHDLRNDYSGTLFLVQDEITALLLCFYGIPAVGISHPEAFRASQTGSKPCGELAKLMEEFSKMVYVLPGEAWQLPQVKQQRGEQSLYQDYDAGAQARRYAEAVNRFIESFPRTRTFLLHADHRQTAIPSRETRWVEQAILGGASLGKAWEQAVFFGEENDSAYKAYDVSSWTRSQLHELLKLDDPQKFLGFHGVRELGSPFKLDRITYEVNPQTGKAEYLAEDTPEPDVVQKRGMVWARMRDGGLKDITNFAMECQLRIMGKGAFGIYQIQNAKTGQKRTVIIRNREFRKAEDFAERVSEIPRLGAFSKASTFHLAKLQQLICEGAPETTNLDRVMGFYRPNDEIDRRGDDTHFWVFGNGILNGTWKPTDEQGLVTVEGETFYLPAYSSIKEDPERHEKRYERQIGFTFEPGVLDLADWQQRIMDVYGENGLVGIAYSIMAMYYDLILDKQGEVPLLHLVGPPGTGKNKYIESFSRLWAKSLKWMDLQTAKITPAGYAAFFEQYANALNIVNEYNPSSVDDARLDPIKSTYEGKLGEKKAGPHTTEMYSGRVTSAVVIMGQEEIYQKKAINHRCIVIELPERSYTQRERDAFNELKDLEAKGLGNIFQTLAAHRQLIEKDFETKFRTVQQQIDKRIEAKTGNTERLIRNWSTALTCLLLLVDRGELDFVVTPARLLDYAAEQIMHHDRKMTQQGLLQLFFEDFVAAYYMEPRYGLHHNHVYHQEVGEYLLRDENRSVVTPQGIITVQVSNVYPLFQSFLNDRRLKIENSSKSDLRREMKQHPAFLAASPNEQIGFKMDEKREIRVKYVGDQREPIPHRSSAFVFCAQRLGIDLRRAWSFEHAEQVQPETHTDRLMAAAKNQDHVPF